MVRKGYSKDGSFDLRPEQKEEEIRGYGLDIGQN
jgi:hypothetical protein